MSHVEREIAAPMASPQRLADVVRALPSEFVDAPRELPVSMLLRLGEMARDGQVFLHSRLFAQWMHHAYPQECPFPHSVRGLSTLTPEEWSAQTGLEDLLDRTQVARLLATDFKHEGRGSEVVPWSSTEELVGFHWDGKQEGHGMWRKGMALLAVVSLAVPMMRAWSAALGTASTVPARPKMLEKQMV